MERETGLHIIDNGTSTAGRYDYALTDQYLQTAVLCIQNRLADNMLRLEAWDMLQTGISVHSVQPTMDPHFRIALLEWV